MGCINIKSAEKPQSPVSFDDYPKQAMTLDQIYDMKGQFVIGKVVKIYDGDTITCIINNGGHWIKYKIRLSDIDTCEMKINTKNMDSKETVYANQSIVRGKMAKARLIELVSGGRIKYDTANTESSYPRTVDGMINDMNIFVKIKIEKYESKYGRQLGWIYPVDDTQYTVSFNQMLLDEHHAYPYNGGSKLTILEQLKQTNQN